MQSDDPLVQALPPNTDYLTYCTLLEYQLTPQRLPLLHTLLQDEKLTTNIGWDLVKLLLPMLPASTECLHDVARLGNPREVILRVSESLMQLHPEDDEDDFGDAEKPLPPHTLQFNCLLAMLSVLHSRIQTKSPSRFVATSLQAALEAYTAMPSNETTLALLEFLRELTPTKRPAPPPRVASESSVLRVLQKSAPDPEAEAPSPSPSPAADNETLLVQKFVQFGLLELLKSYLLNLSGPLDPGMAWATRMQEHLHPDLRLPEQSLTDAFATNKPLKERDMIMGKIVALSRDVEITNDQLLAIISQTPTDHRPPLDFDEPPESPDNIPLERHGSLLLLAARAAGAILYGSGHPMPQLSIFPDMAKIFGYFVGGHDNLDEVAFGQPHALLDSLLALTVHTTQQPIAKSSTESEFKDFILILTACTARQTHDIVRQIPASIVHSHPSQPTRYKLIRTILEDDRLQAARDSAISWLKQEILTTDALTANIFLDPLLFMVLLPLLCNLVPATSSASDLVACWTRLTQTQGPPLHSALSLYYLLLSSQPLRDGLQLEKSYKYFREHALKPLRQLFSAFDADLARNGGEGLIEAAVGEDTCGIGMTRCGMISLTLDQIEETAGDAFGTDETELQEFSEEDLGKVEKAKKEMVF
ncbi:YAP-binding/Alf4/Glomulin [Penicillium riverlandense]|uniref:YAP-binding/Alf4/Glomulin n=1 Tax=Penicillium riverlandense TaxID=1903569 RepID=UPI002547AB10|nr:YAP-binding/Alf4/Glomulin [Penicillium riverlandense]KAJ5811556.1 YAP-binding/Alf4/Glomulin [Penicillium riverlandense]